MPTINKVAVVFVFLVAAACSSGGEKAIPPERSDYRTMLEEGTRLGNKLAAHRNEIPTMPSKGTAGYKGIANLNQNNTLYARVALSADFGNNAISGRIDDFTTSGDKKISGHAEIAHGRINGRDFDSRLSGIFDGKKLTGKIDGRFYGKNAEIIAGGFKAEVQGQSYRGDFRAENKKSGR